MAATPFDPSHLGANPFDIYTDGSVPKNNAPLLPGGSCNFVDLSPGANGARCGCRRFWSRCSIGSLAPDQTHWCMCNHHACFHEEGDRDVPPPELNIPGQENEKPRTGREPLSPVMDLALKMPSAVPGLDFLSFTGGEGLSFAQNRSQEASPHAKVSASPRPGASLPDTLDWGGFLQSQPGLSTLPPIPAQCLIPSQTASTTSSMQTKYLRPFSGRGLQTLSGVSGVRPRPYPPGGSHNSNMARVSEEPDPRPDSFVFVTQDQHRQDTPTADAATQAEPRAAGSQSSVSRRAFKNLSDTVGGHEQRLDRLETISFSGPGHEECQEKHDNTDIRITELEGRVDEVEKLVNDNGSVTSRRLDRNDNASVVSMSTNATSHPTHSQELYSQVQTLQAQVVQLQALMPSPNHPWEVEVVFLPFPLRKVWQESHEFKSEPQLGSDEWTQLPMTHSTATLRSQSPFYGDWISPDSETEWLLPKACGDKSIVDKRLRSRGLIKTLTVKGSDARSVVMAMNIAFASVFRDMQLHSRSQAPDPRVSTFLGLQSTWVPLRKIHKDSRLRFLSPAEMISPAIWDVQFLNSIMMRSSEPRLFVTHPDAYLQDFQAYETGWTWQRVREMSRVYPTTGSPRAASEEDAREDYWSWSEQLDEPTSAHASMAARQDRQTVSSSPSQQYFPAIHAWKSSSPTITRAKTPLLNGRRASRPPHIRTASMPISGPTRNSPSTSGRRVVSYGQSRRSSPAVRTNSQSAVTKPRRARSPSHHRFTPRWTASPSPMPLGLPDRQTARGTTPFAYATPYSNAPLQEGRGTRSANDSYDPNQPEYASDEELGDIEIYESESDDLYGNDDDSDGSISSVEMDIVPHAQPDVNADPRGWHLPEDEPWPGIEDQGHLSDGENIDPHEMDRHSDVSSQPSEYPSTQRAWPDDAAAAFQIHEDDEPRQ
ncbi:hypothetical protein G7046_g7852 [Stylonectria norvegica]|nr:hypothetical protein G7046_g7852 [Stylonectria norvegica]